MNVLRAVTLTLPLLALTGCPATKNAKPSTFPKGTVEGMPLTTKIGAAGGTARSGSGDLAVTIPAGALAADTDITVTPITGTAPGLRGRAYRLGPDDVTFSAPVTVTFSYDDAALEGASAEALAVAFQHASGYWVLPEEPTLDAAAKTVSVKTTHFSDWSLVAGAQLRPPSKKIKPKQAVTLRAVSCFFKPPEPIPGLPPELAPLRLGYNCEAAEDDVTLPVAVSDWAVNGAPGGTDGLGLVKGELDRGTYTAPSKKPSPATVAVSAKVKLATSKSGVLVVSNVTIVDGATLHVVATYEERKAVVSNTLALIKDSFEFDMSFPPASETVAALNRAGELKEFVDTRMQCKIPPQASGPYDELRVDELKLTGSTFEAKGVHVVPAVTLGTGEGACLTTETLPAQTAPATLTVTLPVEFLTNPTVPTAPVTSTQQNWTITYTTNP